MECYITTIICCLTSQENLYNKYFHPSLAKVKKKNTTQKVNFHFFFQATANTRLAGAIGAYFLRFLHKKFHLDLFKVHMIGHSLGAHLSG